MVRMQRTVVSCEVRLHLSVQVRGQTTARTLHVTAKALFRLLLQAFALGVKELACLSETYLHLTVRTSIYILKDSLHRVHT